jgi:hypothetical protein
MEEEEAITLFEVNSEGMHLEMLRSYAELSKLVVPFNKLLELGEKS